MKLACYNYMSRIINYQWMTHRLRFRQLPVDKKEYYREVCLHLK